MKLCYRNKNYKKIECPYFIFKINSQPPSGVLVLNLLLGGLFEERFFLVFFLFFLFCFVVVFILPRTIFFIESLIFVFPDFVLFVFCKETLNMG